MTRATLYVVEVVESATGVVAHRIGEPGMTERNADRVEDGVNRNLNHDRFYTRVVEVAS